MKLFIYYVSIMNRHYHWPQWKAAESAKGCDVTRSIIYLRGPSERFPYALIGCQVTKQQ